MLPLQASILAKEPAEEEAEPAEDDFEDDDDEPAPSKGAPGGIVMIPLTDRVPSLKGIFRSTSTPSWYLRGNIEAFSLLRFSTNVLASSSYLRIVEVR